MADEYDYWKNASLSDWNDHVANQIDMSRCLLRDPDYVFGGAIHVLSDAYLSAHGERAVVRPNPVDERELEDLFWGLQRSSLVIDSIVGSACVVLMRWISAVKRIAISDLILLETKFPFQRDQEPEKGAWDRHNMRLMHDHGARVPSKDISGALAIWQIGNVFKHASDGYLNDSTARVAARLGHQSRLIGGPESAEEEKLRQLSLDAVGYTLDADSIERMAIQLGCGPVKGLMPLYDLVESWTRDIDKHFSNAVALRRGSR